MIKITKTVTEELPMPDDMVLTWGSAVTLPKDKLIEFYGQPYQVVEMEMSRDGGGFNWLGEWVEGTARTKMSLRKINTAE